jgi:inosine-uridine nucleoside N-ribohydrolase
MQKIHLDTDIGGDMDDVCALAMLLKWHDVEITGITTSAEEGGRRAGYVREVLALAGRSDIPYAAGADLVDGCCRYKTLGYPADEDNWGKPVPPQPGAVDGAIELLRHSIEAGATLVGIGPYTNFRLLDEKYPGFLKDAPLYLMGGYVYDVPPEYHQWDKHDDWNIQLDVPSARYVLEHAHPTLVTLTVSGQTALRRAYLPRLAQAGALGELLVRQAELFAKENGFEAKFGAVYPGLPDDMINFQHDPLACAIALGWHEGVEVETVPLRLEERDTYLYEIPDASGNPTRVVTKIDGGRFNQYWLDVMCS